MALLDLPSRSGRRLFAGKPRSNLMMSMHTQLGVTTEKVMAGLPAAGIGAFVEERSMPKWNGD